MANMIKPTHASKLENEANSANVNACLPSPIYLATISAAILAMTTFLNKPIQNLDTPKLKSVMFSFLL